MVHYQEVTLRDVAEQARYVLLVKKTEPFVGYEDVTIGEDPVKYPPFKKTKYNFIVSGRLDKAGDGPKIGEKIVAVDAGFVGKLEAHKSFYLHSRSKSPIIDKYESMADFEKEKELILFISFFSSGEYLFSAFESTSKSEEIKKILETFPPKAVDLAEEDVLKDSNIHKPLKPQ